MRGGTRPTGPDVTEASEVGCYYTVQMDVPGTTLWLLPWASKTVWTLFGRPREVI